MELDFRTGNVPTIPKRLTTQGGEHTRGKVGYGGFRVYFCQASVRGKECALQVVTRHPNYSEVLADVSQGVTPRLVVESREKSAQM